MLRLANLQCAASSVSAGLHIFFFFFKQKTAYEIGLGIPAEPLFRSILALLQRIFLMSSLMLLLVWLIFFMVLIKLLPILGTISGKTVKLMVLALICLGNNRQD